MTKEGKRLSASFQLSPRKRKSILGTPGQMAPSPASRRSILMAPPEPIPMDDGVFQDLSENNDEQEKRQRQLNRLQEKQHRDFASPTVQGAEKRKSLSGAEGLSNQQLSDHYTKCIQLSSENKINVKNAFNLNLIDYMSEMVRRKNTDMNNFQLASCTLDASTKIYAYRVDSIHTDTLKMAGGLGRTQDKKGEGEGGEDGQDGTGMEAHKKKRTKKRNTVETNIKNLNLNHYDLEYDIDPLFKKQSAQFDDGRSGKEFLCALHLLDDTCQMILDSETIFMNSALEELTSQKKQVAIPSFPDMSDKLICPTFSSFEFSGWRVEDEAKKDEDAKKEEEMKEADHAFDINAEPEPLDDEPYFENDDGFGIGDVAGDDYDENGTVITVGHGAHERGPPPKMEAVNLKDYLADTCLEYSYFDTNRLTAWGGPRHWKFKALSKEKKPASSNNEEKKSKKENIVLAYQEPEIDKYFAITRKAIKLSQTTFKTWTKDKTTLPVDLHYDSADFHRLYGRAAIYIRRLGSKEGPEVDENVTDYNYDNANDDNFCADVDDGMDDYGDNDADASQAGYDLTMFSQTQAPMQDGDVKPGDLFDNLVAAPNRVAKINIGYARTAKKIDMKKLKSSMWGILTEPTAVRDDKENKSGAENQAENTLNEAEKMDENQSIGFSQMYHLLPTKVSNKMSENLSVPLAFIALLHLCNEHSLQLTGREDMADFTVKQN